MKENFNKRRNRGRPKTTWIDLIKEDTNLPVATAEKYEKDGKKWRNNVNTKLENSLLGVSNSLK